MASLEQDHYAVLGVKTTDTLPQLKSSFQQKLGSLMHPDKHRGENSAMGDFQRVSNPDSIVDNEADTFL